jgi:hypothetical protein
VNFTSMIRYVRYLRKLGVHVLVNIEGDAEEE